MISNVFWQSKRRRAGSLVVTMQNTNWFSHAEMNWNQRQSASHCDWYCGWKYQEINLCWRLFVLVKLNGGLNLLWSLNTVSSLKIITTLSQNQETQRNCYVIWTVNSEIDKWLPTWPQHGEDVANELHGISNNSKVSLIQLPSTFAVTSGRENMQSINKETVLDWKMDSTSSNNDTKLNRRRKYKWCVHVMYMYFLRGRRTGWDHCLRLWLLHDVCPTVWGESSGSWLTQSNS